MPPESPLVTRGRWLRACVFSASMSVLAMTAHLLAGGRLPSLGVTVLAGLLVTCLTFPITSVDRSVAGVIAITTAAQGALHVAFALPMALAVEGSSTIGTAGQMSMPAGTSGIGVAQACRPIAVPHRPKRARLRDLGRLVVGGVLTTVVAPSTAASASAHVQVDPSTTAPGSTPILTFRVPTESVDASTTKVEVTLLSTDPFPSVSARALAGWTVTVTEAKLPTPVVDDDGATLTQSPHTVTWTADVETAVPPGQFQGFELEVGPLPATGSVVSPVTQTYSDGSVVKCDEATPADGEPPEHPAPGFDVAASAAITSSKAASTSDGTARTLGVVGAIAAGIGLADVTAARKRTPA